MIATKTNLEITEYREKFFLGLSLRQLACFAAAAMLAIATCFVCLHWLRMDMQVVSYIVMVEVLPFLGLGFIHRDGYPFEKLVKIYWAWHSENAQPSSLRGGPGSPSVGINLDCSSFVQYCYWAQNLPFSAGSTAAYRNAADLVSISTSEVQPGDLRVVYASGGEQGHVQMALGGDAWIECCYGYGVAVNMSNAWMESRPCYYFRYAGF